MIRGVIFDCFGVLYSGSLETFLRSLPAEQAIQLRDVNKSYDYGYISREKYIAEFASLLGKTPAEITETLRSSHVRNEELVEYVRTLSATYRVGLLSNVGSDTMDKLFRPGELENLFDAVVLSYKEGVAKPHPDAFVLAATRLGLLPEECIMIDDLMENCESAEVAGMTAILHTDNAHTKQKLYEALVHDETV